MSKRILKVEMPFKAPTHKRGHYVGEVLWADGGGDGGSVYEDLDELIALLIASVTHQEPGYVPPVIGLAHYYPSNADDEEPLEEFSAAVFADGWTMASWRRANRSTRGMRK